MNLESLTNNPLVKTVLMKQLKRVVEENNVTLITITPDGEGELNFNVYTDEMKVIPKTDFIQLLK